MLRRSGVMATLVLAALALAGCNAVVKITDGKVPTDYQPLAQPLLGKYVGNFDQKNDVISIYLLGDQVKMVAHQDLAGPTCGSQIGNLTEITYTNDNDNPHVIRAVFDFDPGSCVSTIVGSQIILIFDGAQRPSFELKLIDHYNNDEPVYRTGRFSKG